MDVFISRCSKYYVPFGRILVGAYFLLSGLPKLLNLEMTAEMIDGVGFPFASFLALVVALLEIGAGAAIMVNRYAAYAALLLAGFVLIVSFPFHGPQLWAEAPMEQYAFMKNMALMGALLFMAAHVNAKTCPIPRD